MSMTPPEDGQIDVDEAMVRHVAVDTSTAPRAKRFRWGIEDVTRLKVLDVIE